MRALCFPGLGLEHVSHPPNSASLVCPIFQAQFKGHFQQAVSDLLGRKPSSFHGCGAHPSSIIVVCIFLLPLTWLCLSSWRAETIPKSVCISHVAFGSECALGNLTLNAFTLGHISTCVSGIKTKILMMAQSSQLLFSLSNSLWFSHPRALVHTLSFIYKTAPPKPMSLLSLNITSSRKLFFRPKLDQFPLLSTFIAPSPYLSFITFIADLTNTVMWWSDLWSLPHKTISSK